MSGYIVEEPNECPIFFNSTTQEEIIEYWRLYSPIQKKRFNKVMRQLREVWFNVYKTIKFIRDNNKELTIDGSNDLMNKIYRLFIIEHKGMIEFYNDEKIRQRKQKGYLSKKINKLKNSKNKL